MPMRAEFGRERETFLALPQRLDQLLALRDVGVGANHAAVRQRHAANLQCRAVGPVVFISGAIVEPRGPGDRRDAQGGGEFAAIFQELQNIDEAGTRGYQFGWQIQ